MPVGYGYDKNTQPLFIDWSEISKSFTDEIKARKEKGETEKQSILDNRKDFDKLLINRPSGQNEVANTVITSAVDQIKEYSLANFNRYKDKQTTLGQYKNFENNLNSSTSLLFDAVGNFNKNFDEFATRAQNGTASQIEVFMHEMMQNYTDFGRIAVNVDPRTGSIIIAQLDENGEVTDKTLDVSQLGYFSKYKRDSYNINGEVAKVADALGTKFIQDSSGKSLKYQGMMYDELVNNDELMKGLDAEVNSLIDQGFELESVLADSMNYNIVTEKSDNPNELYFNQDSNEFEISDTQKQAAFQHVRDKLARAITVERKEPQAEDELTAQEIQTNLIRKFDFVARNKDKIPPEFINQVLTPEEQVQFTKYIEDSGVDENALGNVLEQVTTFVDFTNEKEGETGNYKKRAINFLNNVGETFGFTFDTQGNVGNNLTGRGTINIKFGDDTEKVSLRKADGTLKSDQELLNDVVLKMYQFKPLKTLVTDITLRASQPQGSKPLD
tara:strand:+ start:583 stop:2079 length:1497 start_codon:yes stop_codon:yes gene_type:complete